MTKAEGVLPTAPSRNNLSARLVVHKIEATNKLCIFNMNNYNFDLSHLHLLDLGTCCVVLCCVVDDILKD